MTNLRKTIEVSAVEKIKFDNAVDPEGLSVRSNQSWLNSTMNRLNRIGRAISRGAQHYRITTRADVRSRVFQCIRTRRRRLVTESLESRQLLAADLSLVADVEQIGAPNYIGGLEIGGKFYFRDTSPIYGGELFSYDPIANTKTLVADINPGLADSQPGNFQGFVQAGTKLFFAATDATIGRELRWFDTALANPTVHSIDINAGAEDSDPGNSTGFKLVGNKLYFGARSSSLGQELHWIDTTSPTPTVNSLDIYAGTTNSFAGFYGGFYAVGAKLYFTAQTAAAGMDLRWIDTNQSVPTLNTIDVYAGVASSDAGQSGFHLAGNNLYFSGKQANGNELRWIDTTVANPTVRSLDIFAGGSSSNPGNSGGFASIGNRLYFSAQDVTRGVELRWIDTTLVTPTLQSIDIYTGSASSDPGFNGFLQVAGNKLYFSARDAATGYELRWLDSTLASPVIHTLDVFAGTTSSSPDTLTLVGDKLYFSAVGATSSTELHWIDTSLAAPVANVLDINPGNNPGFPGSYGGINVGAERFYFTAQTSNVYSLKWISSTQTTPTVNTVAIQSSSFGSEPGSSVGMALANGKLFFPATTNFIAGNELRMVDTVGPEGVFSTFDLRAGTTASGPGIYGGFKVMGSKLFFTASDSSGAELRWIDAQATNPVINTIDVYGGTGSSFAGQYGGFAAVGSRLYFSANVPGTGVELRWVDTSVASPVVNTLDINPGSNNSMALQYTSFKQAGNKLYFTAETPGAGVELRWIDVTLATPILNTLDVFTGASSSKAGELGGLITVGDKLFFTAKDADNGEELRWIDTTATTPTLRTLDIYSGSIGSMAGQVGGFTAVGTKLYFTARGNNGRLELRWIDAALETPSLNTITVSADVEFSPGQFKGFVAAGTKLYFTSITSTHGEELRWIDTTLASPTVQTIDLYSGTAGSSVGQYGGFTLFDNKLYFTAVDSQIGAELRWIDTTLSTPIVSSLDVNTGISSSYAGRYSGFHSSGTKLYFSADKIGFGTELFAIETAPATLNASSDGSGNWTITDVDSVGKDNHLTISRDGTNYVITSSIEKFPNGSTSLSIPQAALTGSLTINAAGGSDTTVLNYASGNPVPAGGLSFLGGTSSGDRLLISGGNLLSTTYNATQPGSGNVNLDGSAIAFIGVESLDLAGSNLTNLTVNIDPQSQTASAIVTTVDVHTSASQSQISFTQGLARVIAGNVTGSLLIQGEAGSGDTINWQGAGTGVVSHVTLDGQGGPDIVNLNSDWTLPANKHLTVTAQSFNLNANADWLTQGTGVITIQADDVELSGTATLASSTPVIIRPITNQRPIDLGTNTAGFLSLTNAELARISSNILVGSSNSGAISISDTIAASGRGLRLVTGIGVTGTGSIVNSHPTTEGEVIFDQMGESTYSGLLGGPSAGTNADKLVSIRKAGAGTLTLNSANTYSGWTSVDAGILRLTHANALGSTVSGTIVSNGASLQLQNSITVLNESLAISGTGVGATGALLSVSGDNRWSGAISLNAAATIANQTDDLFLHAINNNGFTVTLRIQDIARLLGTLSGTGGVTKTGTGQIVFEAQNTYLGVTNILGGSINLANSGTLGSAVAGTAIANGATLAILNTTPVQDDITVSGIGFTGFGAINGDDGAQLVGNVLLVGNARISKFDALSPFVISGNISDGGLGYGIEVRGSETGRAITLAGTNTYTGPTQLIEPVTLNVTGTLTSNVSLVSGARLGGNGTINGSVTSTGTGAVNPGVGAVGRLTVVGNYSANTIFDIQDDYLTAGPNGDYDQLVVQGSTSQINLGTKTVDFQSAGGGTAPLSPNFLTLIKNETSNAIVPFSNLTAGSQVTLGTAAQARNFNSSYVGGNGRDFVLTGIAPNRAPSGSGGALNVFEDTDRVLTVGDFKFSDPDSGDSLQSVTLTSLPSVGQLYLDLNGNLSYDALTETLVDNSVITVAQVMENRLRYLPPVNAFGFSFAYFSFRVSDGQLLSSSSGFTISVASVNDAPIFIAGGNQTIEEDAGPQVVSDWATSISAGPANESTQTLSFQVISNSNPQLFSVAPSVSPIGVLSYTSAPNAFGTAIIGVRLQDSGGTANGGVNNSQLQTFTINVTPVTDDASDVLLSNNTVAENSVAGTPIGSFTIAGSAASYELVSGALDNALFALSGNTLQSAAPLNYELRSTYSVRLRATIGGNVLTADFLILVTPVNEFAPVLTAPQTYVVGENSTLVGTLTASDQDLPAPQLIYNITGGEDQTRFTLLGNRLSFASVPNFESPIDDDGDNLYKVRVSVSDGLRLSETDLTVTVTNANDAPTNVSLNVEEFPESLAAGSQVGLLSATDEDADGPISFAFFNGVASDNADFTIVGNQLRTRREFDYDTLADRLLSVSIVAVDAQRLSSSPTTIDLELVDSAERPTADSQSLSTNRNESLPITLSGEDGNDSPAVQYTIVTPPRFGQLIGTAPEFTYVPNVGFTGTDEFYFTTTNGTSVSYQARIGISVVGTKPTVSFTTPTSSAVESSTVRRLLVQLSEPAATTLTIPISVGPGTTATVRTDVFLPTFITVAAGQSSTELLFIVLNDSLHESSETVELTIGSSAEYLLGAFPTHTSTIIDDDEPPLFELANRSSVVSEDTPSILVSLLLSAPLASAVTIPFTVGGTAQAGLDFDANAIGNSITYPAGETYRSFVIPLRDDAFVDGTKTITIDFGGAAELWPVGATAADRRYTLTIRDDDVRTVNLTSSLGTIPEDANTFHLYANVSEAPTEILRVPIAFSGDASRSGAQADYFGSQTEFVFHPGSTEASIQLSIVDDDQVETAEQLRINLQAGVGYELGTRKSFVGTIGDNDQATVEFSTTSLDVWEASALQIVARLSHAVSTEVVVTTQISTAGSRYAEKDKDYVSNFATFVFAPNSLTASRTISTLDDNLNEDTESVLFTLLTPVDSAVKLGARKSLAISIKDNDPLVSIVRATSSAIESDSSVAQFEVRLSSPTNRDVVTSLSLSGSATPRIDYDPLAWNVLTIPGDTQTTSRLVTLNILDDLTNELPETITASLTVTSGGIINSTSGSATVEIIDNDSATINIETSSGEVQELPLQRANGIFENRILDVKFSVSRPVDRDLYIPVQFLGTATPGLHYNVVSPLARNEVYIAAGSTEGILRLEIINNDDDVGSQDIVVQAIGVNLPATLPASGLVRIFTIVDDDSSGSPFPPFDSPVPGEVYQGEYGPPIGSISPNSTSSESCSPPVGDDFDFAICTTVAMAGSNGPLDGAIAFFDMNFNGILDFVDANGNSQWDANELAEPSTLTAKDGSFNLSLADYDFGGDGFLVPTDGRFVMQGGVDISTGLGWPIPLTAPVGLFSLTPVSTLIESLVRTQQFSVPEAIERTTSVLGLTGYDLTSGSSIYQVLSNDGAAARAYSAHVQLYAAVLGLANYLASFSERDVASLGNQAFASVAEIISGSDATLDLRLPGVIETLGQHILESQGIELDVPGDLTRVSSIIALGIQKLASVELTGDQSDAGQQFLLQINKIKKIIQGELPLDLRALANSAQLEALEIEYSSAGFDAKISNSVASVTVPPVAAINSAELSELNSDTSVAVFSVSLEGAHDYAVSLTYSTSDMSALAGIDYVATSGILTWASGDNSVKTIAVTINGDSSIEPDEQLRILLSQADGLVIRIGEGRGTIINDDTVPVAVNTQAAENQLYVVTSSSTLDLIVNGVPTQTGSYSQGTALFLTGQPDKRDALTIDFSANSYRADQISFNGGTGASVDSFRALAGVFDELAYKIGGATYGQLEFTPADATQRSISELTDVEAIDFSVSSVEKLVIHIPANISEVFIEDIAGGRVRLRGSNGSIIPLDFNAPTEELRLVRASTSTVITVNSTNAGLTSKIQYGFVDITRPISSVAPLPQQSASLSIPLVLSGNDPTGAEGSATGIKEYDLYVSTGSTFALHATVPASSPNYVFTGLANTSYWFRSIARDWAGNVELKNLNDAYTRIVDITPPTSSVLSAVLPVGSGLFQVHLSGAKISGSPLTHFDVYVAIDTGAYALAGTVSAVGSNGSGYTGTLIYQGIADNNSHTYKLYSRARDSQSNIEAAPAIEDVSVTATIAASGLAPTAIDVQNGANQRSYIRNLDILFSSAAGLNAVASPDRIKLERFDIAAPSVTGQGTAVTDPAFNVTGNKVALDFGSVGLGGSRQAGNGFYRVKIDVDGNGSFADAADKVFEFYRLFGDANGDGKVSVEDTDLVTSQMGRKGTNLEADVDGNGTVNSLDRTYTLQQRGKALAAYMIDLLDD